GRQEQVRLEWLEITERRTAAREHAALDAESRPLHRPENAEARDGIVARQDYDVDALDTVGVESLELLDQEVRDTGLRRLLEALQLQPHVRAVVRGLETPILSPKINRPHQPDGTPDLPGQAQAGQAGNHGV